MRAALIALAFVSLTAFADGHDPEILAETSPPVYMTETQVQSLIEEALRPPVVAADLDPSVVVVRSVGGDRIGTGFAISDDYIVTAAHVLEDVFIMQTAFGPRKTKLGDDEHALVENVGGAVAVAEVVYRDLDIDFAVLKLLKEIDVTPVKIADKRPVRGEKCYALGNIRGWTRAFTAGWVAQAPEVFHPTGQRRLLLAMPESFGGSGGAVFNENGDVVGILTEIVAVGISLAIPIHDILDTLEEYLPDEEQR